MVIGLEREQRFVEMTRAEIAKRGMGNVTMVQGDGLNTGMEKGSFDLVHERLVLINVSARGSVSCGNAFFASPWWNCGA